MRKAIILAAAAFTLGAIVAAAQPKKDIGYDSRANAFEQLDAGVAKAAAEDKLLLLISGGDWCIWCHYLAAFLESEKALLSHPKVGATWEGFVIEQVLATEPHDGAWFWATNQGAEIDLVLRRGDRLLGIECKRADAPKLTPSIRIALEELGLERIAVIYPGAKRYPLAAGVEAVPLTTLAEPGQLFGAVKS